MSLSKSFFRRIYKLHVYAGLWVAVHFAIFALSGLPLLFKDEMQSSSVMESNPAVATAENFDGVVRGLRSKYPNDRILALYPDEQNPGVWTARLGANGARELRGARKIPVNIMTGLEITEKPRPASGFWQWLVVLHRELFLGSTGKIYLGIVGTAYVFMLLSGLFIYGKFMKGREFGERRAGRVANALDWHKFAGVVSFGWGLIVGLSGVLLAFNGLFIKFFQFRSLRELGARYTGDPGTEITIPFGDVISTVWQNRPGHEISYISFPGSEYGIPGQFLFLVNGDTPMTKRLSELLVIDSGNAKLTEIMELPFYLKAALLAEPLHFGDYGGIGLKILWACFTLISLAVVLLGVGTFIAKRRASKPEAPKAPPARIARAPKSTYAIPAVLIFVSLGAILASLFVKGIAAALLLIPLATFAWRWRRSHA